MLKTVIIPFVRNTVINRQFKYTYHNAWLYIALVNVLVYIAFQVFPDLIYYMSLVPLYVRFRHFYWQFFTYMFSHASFWHLFSNMLALFVFGNVIEKIIGTREFVLFYFLTGTLSGVASYLTYWYTGMYYTVILGASGAIYALLFLFSVLFPTAVVLLFGIIPMRAPLLVLLYFLIEFISMFRTDGTAHLVHLYGLLFAILYSTIRMRMNPLRRWGLL